MNVLIMTDLEGISCVDTMAMVSEVELPGYRAACERLMADVAAAVDGCLDAGADAVYVVDGHGGGHNFIPELFHPRAVLDRDRGGWEALLRGGQVDAYLEIGCHAMAGTINGFLDHTQNSKVWYNYIVNGRKSGEIAQGAIMAGAFGVPFVMLSGDEAACTEARAFLGDIPTAAVKTGIGRNRARCLPSDEALSRIRAAAAEGLRRIGEFRPYCPILPMEIILEVYRSDFCDAVCERCAHVERLDARSVRKVVHKVETYRDILF